MVVTAVAIGGSSSGSAIGALFAYNYIGTTGDPADPNVITLADGAAPGTKSAQVSGADTATASNVKAYIDASKVTAGGTVSVLAGFDDPTKLANGSPGLGATKSVDTSTVTTTTDTLHIAAHGLNTGDEVEYSNGGGAGIGGLVSGGGTKYYVIKVDANTIKLATSVDDADAGIAEAFTSTGNDQQSLHVSSTGASIAVAMSAVTVDNPLADTIAFASNHGMSTGDAVVYRNGGGTSIGGLVDGETYYVIKVDATHVRLAATLSDATATANRPIMLTSAGSGASQSLQLRPGTFNTGGVTVDLATPLSGQLISVTAAGAGGKSTSGAGAVSLNFVRMNVDAHISNTGAGQSVQAANNLSVLANDVSQIYSGTGALGLSLGNGAAIDASVGVNDIRNSVVARVDGAIVASTAGNVTVAATETARDINVVFGGAASNSGNAFGGSFAINNIKNIVDAHIAAVGSTASDASANGTVSVLAKDTASIATLAGNVSASFSGTAAVGAAFAVNSVQDTVSALIDGSTVTASTGDILVDATFAKPTQLPAGLDAQISAMAVAGSGGPSISGAGSAALNWVRNTVTAKISNIGDIRAGDEISAANGMLSVTASDNSTINALAGAISIAGVGAKGSAGAVGASVAYNYLGGDPNDPTTTSNNVVCASIENVTGSIKAQQVVVSATYNGQINNITVAGSGAGSSSNSFALGGSVSINRIRNTTDAHVSGANSITTAGSLAQSLLVHAEDSSHIWVLAGGVSVAVATGSGTSGAAGVAAASNEITDTVTAYIDNASVTSTGGVEVSASSTSSITALTFGVALAVGTGGGGLAGSGAGAGSGNTVRNSVSSSIRNSSAANGRGVAANGGKVVLSAIDNANIMAGAGALAFGGSFGSGGGAGGSVGISAATNDIADTTSAYIDSSTVTAAGNNIEISATESAGIYAVTIGGAAAGAGGSGGGTAGALAGAGSGNTIKNTTLAYISNNSTVSVTGASSAVNLTASDSSTVSSIAGGLAGAGAGGSGGGAAGSLGAAAATNSIQNIVKAYVDTSKVTSAGTISLTATETGTIATLSIGAAVAGAGGAGGGFGGSAAGSGSGNTVSNTVSAYISGSNGSANGVSATGGAVKLTATDAAYVVAAAGSLAVSGAGGAGGGGAVAVGVSSANNNIANTVTAYIDHSTVSGATGQNVELAANETAVISAMTLGGSVAGSGGAGGGASVAAAGAGSNNTIENKVYAYITNASTVTTSGGGAVKLLASDVSTISAIAGGLGVAGAGGAGGGAAGSMGAAASTNSIQNEVKAYIDSSTVTSAASLEITAQETGAISAVSIGAAVAGAGGAGGGFAASAAGSGSGNTVRNTVAAYIGGSTTLANVSSTAGAVKLSATDATAVTAVAGSLSVSGAGGAGGGGAVAVGVSAASNDIGNTVSAYTDHASVTAAAGQNVEITANETAVMAAMTLGGSVAGSGGAGGGASVAAAGAGSSNAVANKVYAYISNGSTVTTSSGGAVKLSADDGSTISAIAGGLAGSGAGGAGGGGAGSLGAAASTNSIQNEVKAYIDSSTVTSAATLELTAQETGVIASLSIGAAVAGAGGAGGGFAASAAGSGSGNTVKNTIAAYVSGSSSLSHVSSTSGAVMLTATDATFIVATAGSLAIGGSGGAGGGVAGAVGISSATSDIENAVSAYIDHASVSAATGNNIELSANESANIYTMTLGGSFAGSGGAGGGVSLAAAGAVSANTIENKVYAYVANGSTLTASGAGSVKLNASDTSVTLAVGGGLAGSGAGGAGGGVAGSLGAAGSTNTVQNEVKAYIDGSNVNAAGTVELVATENGYITAVSIGAAVAGAGGAGGGFGGAGAGSGSGNTVTNTVAAYVNGSGGANGVSAGSTLTLTATDSTSVVAVAGSLAIAGAGGAGGGGAVAIGVAAATNDVTNSVSAYISSSNASAAGNIELSANESASISAMTIGGTLAGSGGAGGGFSAAAAGAGSGNTVNNTVQTYIANNSVVTKTGGGAVKLTATDSSSIIAVAGSLALSGAGGAGGGAAGSLGVSSATNSIGNQVKSYIDLSKVSSSGSIELTATETGTISAWTIGGALAGAGGAGGGGAASMAGAGSKNTVANSVSAFITNSDAATRGVSATGGAIKLTANDTTSITADAGGYSIALSGGAGGGLSGSLGVAASNNDVRNNISAYIDNASVTGTSANIELLAGESASIKAVSIGAALAGAGGAGGGGALGAAGSGSNNVIKNNVLAYVRNNSVLATSSSGTIKVTATDGSTILANGGGVGIAISGGAGGGFSGAAGVSASTNDIANVVKAYVDNATLTSAGGVELSATEAASISAKSIGGAIAAAGGVGGGGAVGAAGAYSENKIQNTVWAYANGASGSKGITANGGTVKLTATDASTISSDGGGAAVAVGIGGGGGFGVAAGFAVSKNTVGNSVRAYTDASRITANSNGIELKAVESAFIEALNIGSAMAVAVGTVGLSAAGAGGSSTNTIANTVEAYAANASTLTTSGSGAVKLTATDSATANAKTIATSISIAGGLGGGSFSVAAALASNDIGNTVRAYSNQSTINSAGNVELTATSAPSINALTVAASLAASVAPAGAAFSGAGADSHSNVHNTVAAFIQGQSSSVRSTTTAAGGIALSAAENASINAEVGSGSFAVGAIAGSVGISLSSNTVSSSIKAYIDNANVTSSANGISVGASSNDSVTTLAIATSVALGGAAASGAGATASASVNPNVEAYSGSGSSLNAAGDIAIAASSSNTATVTTYGLAASTGIAVGTTTATATANGSVLAHMDGAVSGANNLTVQASGTDSSIANATAASGGIYAGAGTVATATTSPVVRAYSGGTISARNAMIVAATLTPKANATALGVSVGALAVGVSSATSTVSPTVDAHVGGNITAASLNVTATQALPAGAESSNAKATAAAGALIGVTATSATAINGAAGNQAGVSSYVANNSMLNIAGDTFVTRATIPSNRAKPTPPRSRHPCGRRSVRQRVLQHHHPAYLGTGVTLTGSDLTVTATGHDNNLRSHLRRQRRRPCRSVGVRDDHEYQHYHRDHRGVQQCRSHDTRRRRIAARGRSHRDFQQPGSDGRRRRARRGRREHRQQRQFGRHRRGR